MANILILQEDVGPVRPWRNSLECHHQLYFVHRMSDAINLLRTKHIDLIISRVHLDNSNVFEFIKTVKENAAMRHIPFLCFSEDDSLIAKLLDENLEHAALLCGANKYLVLDQYRGGESYDFDALRHSVEECLEHR